MKKKLVYIAFSVDVLHEGHINILKKAAQYGEVVVGLLTDRAISSYKSLSICSVKSTFMSSTKN